MRYQEMNMSQKETGYTIYRVTFCSQQEEERTLDKKCTLVLVVLFSQLKVRKRKKKKFLVLPCASSCLPFNLILIYFHSCGLEWNEFELSR